MTRLNLWSSDKGDIPANLAFTNNYAATTDPGVSNDISEGYTPGSDWLNTATNTAWKCIDSTEGAAVWIQSASGGESLAQFTAPAGSGSGAGGTAKLVGGVGGATGAGGPSQITGGAGGATSGNGGAAQVTGGAAQAGNGNGGSAVLTGGAKNGTGIAGGVRAESVFIRQVAAPAAKTTSGALTGAEVAAGMITVTQGAGANSDQQLPTGTELQAALPADFAVGDSIDFHVINLGGASETATLTVNTDVTIVGRAIVDVAAATASGSGHFRLRKTADHVFVCYRIA